MINENIIKEYDLAYKRKQWFYIWRHVAVAHYKWLEPYIEEMHRRGAYPIYHYLLANYYNEPQDKVIATFISAHSIRDDENVTRSIEAMYALIGTSPYESFRRRDFVHWKQQNLAVFLDGLYRIEKYYGSLQNAVMENMRYACDPAESLFYLLKEAGIPLNMTRCRYIIVRLATKDGVGLGIWESFSSSIIMPPEDEITKWYVTKMFPGDTTFPFDELVGIMTDTPYRVMYDAMMMRLMLQADSEITNKYLWRICQTFYTMPSPPLKVMGNYDAQEYIEYATPVYDFNTATLQNNPRFKGSGTWMSYEDYIKTDKGKAYLERKKKSN